MFSSRLSSDFAKIPFKNIVYRNYSSFSCITNQPELDFAHLCDEKNKEQINQNIKKRKGIGDIDLVLKLKQQLASLEANNSQYESVKQEFYHEACKIPNRTHPEIVNYEDTPKTVKTVGSKPTFPSKPWQFHDIVKKLKLLRTDQLGSLSGSKSYFILGELAELEHALIRFCVSNLLKNNFQLVSVPDILPRNVVEGCGMSTQGDRTQVYELDPVLHGPDLCLSGTSEMALAGLLAGKTLSAQELPLKLAAVSRCYRAETSNTAEERGIYRVHEFTKVEMFAVSKPEHSEALLSEILAIQEHLYEELGLHFVVLDMPPHELGAQAYRKFDVEAWMAGRDMYGEISSCSNCTDYQARRLGIKFVRDGNESFVHTLNGTACAVPRVLIALLEQGQNPNGTISIPKVLEHYLGKSVIGKQKSIPELKLVKNKKK